MSSTAVETRVALHDVEIAFGEQEVLRAASLAVMAGDVVGIHGANGSGKTSLLRVLASVAVPVTGSRDGPLSCAYVPPTIDPLPLRSRDWLRLFPRSKRSDPRPLLQALGFDSDLSKRLGDLSFGNLRKLLLAEALTSGESLIVIDEFTAGLDRDGSVGAHRAVANLAAAGVAVVLADQQGRPFPAGTRVFEIADQALTPIAASAGLTHEDAEVTLRGPQAALDSLLDIARSHGFHAQGSHAQGDEGTP